MKSVKTKGLNHVSFPPLSNANEDGLLAMGGDLSTDTLVSAYAQGIFPWFNENQPLLWWSPDPRLVLLPEEVKISRSLSKIIRQQKFTLSCNQQFENVMRGCALRGNPNHLAETAATWITESMHEAYSTLHKLGYAQSIEVWQDSRLVGGLYGVALGSVFFGESMFSAVSNASKVALIGLCQHLRAKGYQLIDCQVETDHLLSLGAKNISRDDFMAYLKDIDIDQNSADFAQEFKAPST